MKKLVVFAFILLSTQAFSQEQGFFGKMLSRTSFGLKAGGNYSNFVDAAFETEGLPGFHVGGMINFKLSERFSIQQDFLYSTQGAKLKNPGLFSGQKENIELAYMSVPILLRYQTAGGLFLEAGPQANMLITDDEDFAGYLGVEKFADKVDAGIAGGLGYEFQKGPVRGLGISARYYMGFMDVGKFTSASVKPDFKNSVAQVSISYVFGKKN